MPMHTNYGRLAVTITPLRRWHNSTVLFSVKQRTYDEVRAELGEDPHLPVGYGFCRSVGHALTAGLDHAARVTACGDRLDAAITRRASPDVIAAYAEELTIASLDERAWTTD